jgi:hypothetical protein
MMQHTIAANYSGKLLRDHNGKIDIVKFIMNTETKEVSIVGDHGVKACPITSFVQQNSDIVIKFTCRCNSTGRIRYLVANGEVIDNGRIIARINKTLEEDPEERIQFMGFIMIDEL